jgi:hypothetical protein
LRCCLGFRRPSKKLLYGEAGSEEHGEELGELLLPESQHEHRRFSSSG